MHDYLIANGFVPTNFDNTAAGGSMGTMYARNDLKGGLYVRKGVRFREDGPEYFTEVFVGGLKVSQGTDDEVLADVKAIMERTPA